MSRGKSGNSRRLVARRTERDGTEEEAILFLERRFSWVGAVKAVIPGRRSKGEEKWREGVAAKVKNRSTTTL